MDSTGSINIVNGQAWYYVSIVYLYHSTVTHRLQLNYSTPTGNWPTTIFRRHEFTFKANRLTTSWDSREVSDPLSINAYVSNRPLGPTRRTGLQPKTTWSFELLPPEVESADVRSMSSLKCNSLWCLWLHPSALHRIRERHFFTMWFAWRQTNHNLCFLAVAGRCMGFWAKKSGQSSV